MEQASFAQFHLPSIKDFVMFWTAAEKWETAPGPVIAIDCPACHYRGARARTALLEETSKVLYVVPIWTSRSVLVKCLECGMVFTSRASIPKLQRLSPEECASYLRVRGNLLGTVFALLALLMSGLPLVGQVMAVVAILLNRKSPVWVRVLSHLALLISVAFLCLWLYRWHQGMFD